MQLNTFKKNFYIAVILLLSVSFVNTAKAQPDPEILKRHIAYLSSDRMKGRGTGSKESEKAAKYIRKRFKKLNLSPKGTNGFYQEFTAKVRRVTVPDSIRKANNVIGYLDNGAANTIIVGAHYDHLGMGKQGSSKAEFPEGQIHNGADDNASGVAGVLEVARYFARNGIKEPVNFLFIAFGAEELGLVGSRYFVNNPTIPLENVHFMSNMDMIGRYNSERGVGIGGYGTSGAWPAIFENIPSTVKFFTDRAGSGGSDHASFYAKQIPVLFFHTGGHADYHMPTDDADKVDVNAQAGILSLQIALIERAMKLPKLQFTEVN